MIHTNERRTKREEVVEVVSSSKEAERRKEQDILNKAIRLLFHNVEI
jgi:hypothetical protein